VAAVFLVVLVVVPRMGALACMESYPVQCRIVEIVHSGLAITGVVLIASVASIFLASRAGRPKLRATGVVAGFVGLAIVMALGAELSWAHSIELRY
jgi:prolipoprotein diacylglyceryltransferase